MEFRNYKVGDIITLSDIQTQSEFDQMSVDFLIREVRTYKEPSGFFIYTGYIAEYQATDDKEAQTIMLLLREFDEDYDFRVFYMDTEGSSPEFESLFVEVDVEPEEEDGPGEEYEDGDMAEIIEADEHVEEDSNLSEDLVDRFEVVVYHEDNELEITWDRQGDSWFGIETWSTKTEGDTKTFAEYFTNDECAGNPHCFVEWTGGIKEGWIEVWYGCDIRENDIEFFHTNKED